MADDESLMTRAEVAALFGVTQPAILNWERSNKGLSLVRIGHRCVRYRRAEVERLYAQKGRLDAHSPSTRAMLAERARVRELFELVPPGTPFEAARDFAIEAGATADSLRSYLARAESA